MEKIIINFDNIIEFIKNNINNYDYIISSDYIRKRSILKYFQINNFYIDIRKLFSFDEFVLNYINDVEKIPRYIERKIFKESIKNVEKFREYYENEDFITQLIYEYWEIKENVLNGLNEKNLSDEFLTLDKYVQGYLDKLKNISMDNKIIKYYHEIELYKLFEEKISEIKDKKFLFCCFFYTGPTFINIIKNLIKSNHVEFLLNPIPDYLLKYYEEHGICSYLNCDIKANRFNIKDKLNNSKIYVIPDKYTEIIFINNKIRELLKNFDINNIFVSFPKVSEYEDEIISNFENNDIPFILEARKRIKIHNLIENKVDSYEGLGKLLIDNKNILKEIYNQDILNYIFRSYINFYHIYKVLYKINLLDNILSDFINYLNTQEIGSEIKYKNVIEFINLGNAEARKGSIIFISGVSEEMFPEHLKTSIIFKEDYKNIKIKRTDDFHIHENIYWIYSAINNFDNIIITYPSLGKSYKNSLLSYIIEKVYFENNLDNIENKKFSVDLSILTNNSAHSEIDVNKDLCLKKIDNFKNRGFPATGISEYYTCPFKFYLKYILEISEIEKPFSTVWYGNVVHNILKEIYDLYKNKSIEYMDKESIKDFIKQKLDEHLKNSEKFIDIDELKEKKEELFIEILNSIVNDLKILNDKRYVIDTEMKINLKLDDYLINGRIDRIDHVDNKFYIILDYKFSSSAESRKRKMWDGKNSNDLKNVDLNLLIYFYYYSYILKKDVVAFYLPIRSAKIENVKLYSNFNKEKYNYFKNSEDLKFKFIQLNNVSLNYIRKFLISTMDEISKCNFEKNDESCEDCEFYHICWGE
ncbi:MAG: PD-(D/E)XK nuclease family protein [Thermoplasmata archaeon]